MVKASTADRTKASGIDVQAADVGRRIRQARLEQGMSLAKLGGEDLSRSFLSLVELGRSRISLRALALVAARLELPISYFLSDDTGTDAAVLELTLDQAEAAYGRRQPDEALRILDDVELTDTLRPRALWIRGSALIDLGRPREAIAILQDAVPLVERSGDVRLAIQTHYRLAMALYAVGSYDDSLSHLRQAHEGSEQDLADPIQAGKIAVVMGHILYMTGEATLAVQQYQRSREIFGKLNDLENLASVYSGLSLAYKRKDDLPNALRYSKLSLGVYEANQNNRAAANELNNMAGRYQEVGDLPHALECAQESIERAQRVNAPDIEAVAHSSLAAIYLEMGQVQEATAEATIADEMSSADTDLARLYAWLVLAKIADKTGEHERMDDLYTRALRMFKQTERHGLYADAALAYSLALRSRGKIEEALDLALQAAQAKPARAT